MKASIVFAGPSAGHRWSEWAARDEIVMQPPAIRGDIANFVACHPPATIVLADGAFDRSYAVGHRELMDAAAAGWRIIGVASLGAIRAADLPNSGITGVGAAYAYLQATNAPDDHLALVHESRPPFRILAEALFDVRSCLLERSMPAERVPVMHFLRDIGAWWFCDRTIDRIEDHLLHYVGADRATHLLAPFGDPAYVRAKQADLIAVMTELVR